MLDDRITRNESGCWIWTGAVQNNGYGVVYVGGAMRLAHRVSYEQAVGPIPAGLELDHLCRITLCVNPEHLEPVTHRENVRRGLFPSIAGLHQLAKTHCPQGHPYDLGNTYVNKRGARMCRECNRARQRKGNSPASRTHCPQGHPYDAINTYRTKENKRMCRECMRARRRLYVPKEERK